MIGAKKTALFRQKFFAQLFGGDEKTNQDKIDSLVELLASDGAWENVCWQHLDRQDIEKCRRLASCWYQEAYAVRAFDLPWTTVMPILLSIKQAAQPAMCLLVDMLTLL